MWEKVREDGKKKLKRTAIPVAYEKPIENDIEIPEVFSNRNSFWLCRCK